MSEFDLVCGAAWLRYAQASAFLLAVLAGCLLWQWNGERYGALPLGATDIEHAAAAAAAAAASCHSAAPG